VFPKFLDVFESGEKQNRANETKWGKVRVAYSQKLATVFAGEEILTLQEEHREANLEFRVTPV
jgi:hypothetical protein